MAQIELKGRLDIFLMDHETGEILDERHIENTVVDGGEIWVAELLSGKEYGDPTLSYGAGELGWGIQYLQVGSSTGATLQTDYNVDTSGITGAANSYYTQITSGDKDIISPGNEMVLTASFATNEGLGNISEAGLFSSSGVPTSSTDTSSRMFSRVNFATITKTTSITLTFEWHITVGTVT